MIVYFAGKTTDEAEEALLLRLPGNRRLVSFVDTSMTKQFLLGKDTGTLSGLSLFLDSGAFSAWSRGTEIDIQQYIAFIKEHEHQFEIYAGLDVIGDSERTLENQKIMEEAGLKPLPCFHFGEDFKYLKYYVENYDYMALGGLVGVSGTPEMYKFLDAAFDIICDSNGYPKIKVHGFGVASLTAMKRYPWFSVDASSWLVGGKLGVIYVPCKLPDGSWDFLEKSTSTRKIAISEFSTSKKDKRKHFFYQPEQIQNEVLEWITEHGFELGEGYFKEVFPDYELAENEVEVPRAIGFIEFYDKHIDKLQVTDKKGHSDTYRSVYVVTKPGIINDGYQRNILNAVYFKELSEHFPPWPTKRKKYGASFLL